MKKNIEQILDAIVSDNKEYILNDQAAADYLLNEVENNPSTPSDFFEESERNDETGWPSEEALEELKEYISDNYDYFAADYNYASTTFVKGFSPLGESGQYATEAFEALGLNELREEEWCDIYVDDKGHRVAVYGNVSTTGHGVFLYKNLD